MENDVTLASVLERVTSGDNLSATQSEYVMEEIFTGRATSAQIAGFLVALKMKGETVGELVGMARIMRTHSVKLDVKVPDCFDTCGTGGDGAQTFNVSSVAAVVLAGAGVAVAKHGNRSVSSRSGSADLFEAFGVNVEAPPSVVERCLMSAGIAFCYAPTFHPSMKHVGPTRRELGIRTAFNLLGPLTNPARVRRQIVGVPNSEVIDLVASALLSLGSERVWVVHGAGGLDELSPIGSTEVCEIHQGQLSRFSIQPEDFGVKPSDIDALRVDSVVESHKMAASVLAGESGPGRDIVLMNAAAGLVVAGQADTLDDGMRLAAAAIDEGRASAVLEQMVTYSQDVDRHENGR